MAAVCGLGALHAAPLRVAALHPLMADLAKQVGGERVEVFDLVSEGGNPHLFEPRPDDMTRMREASLVLAAGMGLEPYLGRLRDTLGANKVVNMGAKLPPLASCGDTCKHHNHGPTDPHWWHSIDRMARASRSLAETLASRDPEGAPFYQQQASNYRKRLDALKSWARLELAKIPRAQRKLVTAHNAFAYFADDFDFDVTPVAGLNHEQGTAPQDLAATIEAVRMAGVSTVFPEQFASTKAIEAVCRATGTQMGTPLIADGNGTGNAAGFEGMIRHNVRAITNALAKP